MEGNDGERMGHWLPALRPDDIPSINPSRAIPKGLASSIPMIQAGQSQTLEQLPLAQANGSLAMPVSQTNGNITETESFAAEVHAVTGRGLRLEEPPRQVGLAFTSSAGHGGNANEVELSSDEDDERMDPAWGIKHQDTQQFLAQVQRSASFPELTVPDKRTASPEMPSSLPANQVACIIQEGRVEDEQMPKQDKWDMMPQSATEPENTQESGFPLETEDYTQKMDEEYQERFDEGIPLIPERSPSSTVRKGVVSNQRPPLLDIFGSQDEEDEGSFFSKASEGLNGAQALPHWKRKTTAEVLWSIHSSAQDEPESPTEDTNQLNLEQSSEPSHLGTEPVKTLEPVGRTEDDLSAMWEAALGDDEFLVEDPDDFLPDSPPGSPPSSLKSPKGGEEAEDGVLKHLPPVSATPKHNSYQASNPSAHHQPSTTAQLSPTTYENVDLSRSGLSIMNSMQQHFQPIAPVKAESFADLSKGGYKSPYDMPLELSKPRKRLQTRLPTAPPSLPPPPSSSSMSSDRSAPPTPNQLQSPFSPTRQQFIPPARSSSVQVPPAIPESSSSAHTLASTSSTFFEELPITSRPRPPAAQARYSPQQPSTTSAPQLHPRSPPSSRVPPPQPSSDPFAQYQLQPPERLDPFASVSLQPPVAPASVSTRYSPAPAAQLGGIRPSPSPKYSPAPSFVNSAPLTNLYASQPRSATQPGTAPPSNRYMSQPYTSATPTPPTLPFQPRTSSPLAYFGKTVDEEPQQPPPTVSGTVAPSSPSLLAQQGQAGGTGQVQNLSTEQRPAIYSPGRHATGVVPKPLVDGSSTVSDFAPPRRSQTQSPGKRAPVSRMAMVPQDSMQRPASAQGQGSPIKTSNPYELLPPQRSQVRQRGLSQQLNFIPPVGELQHDQLQRWKGCPIFRFGIGGSVVSNFPRHTPRHSAGSAAPSIFPSAGDTHIKLFKDLAPVTEHITTFVGPLRSKSKKKEVLGWLSSRIDALEKEELYLQPLNQLPDPRKCHSEKILLWKIVKVLVEHDGILELNPDARKAVNVVLSPEIYALDETSTTQYSVGSELSGIYKPAGPTPRTEVVDPNALESLRRHLLRGEREKAVWHAVDHRLWSHALLISSTLDRGVWRQVVQEFVRQEVKIVGNNTESVSALYEVFAGNLEESIDELVPPSARAGLKMISKVDSAGPTKNALDGLDRWRETLSLILSNRCPEDYQAIAAFGGLLANYGRVEASHICYLFSRSSTRPNVFSGADDPTANIVLLGVDHRGTLSTLGQDEESIMLTEVFEFATNVLSNSPSAGYLPHLQAYKLQRALMLASNGCKTEAQAYCDAIAAITKSTTKVSPYYNAQLFGELDELSRRLKETPAENSSWIAKPSIEKVSGSVWNKFSSFVAGDESDTESKGSGKDASHESGPFANVAGTPSMSRSGSITELYSSHQTGALQTVPNTLAGSRYAPRASVEKFKGRAPVDSQRSPPSMLPGSMQSYSPYEPSSNLGQQGYRPQSSGSYQPLGQSPPPTKGHHVTPPHTSYLQNGSLGSSPPIIYQPQPPESYVPTPPPEESLPSYIPNHQSANESEVGSSRQIIPQFKGHTLSTQPEVQETEPEQRDGLTNSQLSTQSYGYEPPTDTGYAPYEPEPDSDDVSAPKPKKSIMDFADDDFPQLNTASQPPATEAAAASEATARRRANDEAAAAAFRAAAEADAARDKAGNEAKEKTVKHRASGWLGGWLGGGKKSDSLDSGSGSSQPQKAIRAKLGEESSFYYDKEAKQWRNRKNPDGMQAGAKATPPPPKGAVAGLAKGLTSSASLPSLSEAARAGPPIKGPPSRTSTPGDGMGSMGPPSLPGNGPPQVGPPQVRPPSSSGSVGGAGTPPMGGVGFAPPSRPSTSMSNASSIDDLLGPPNAGGRRSMRSKKGPAKGRYVDIMATGK